MYANITVHESNDSFCYTLQELSLALELMIKYLVKII